MLVYQTRKFAAHERFFVSVYKDQNKREDEDRGKREQKERERERERERNRDGRNRLNGIKTEHSVERKTWGTGCWIETFAEERRAKITRRFRPREYR